MTDGRPLMAHGQNAQKILERIQRLSAAYGTKVDIHDGVGLLKL